MTTKTPSQTAIEIIYPETDGMPLPDGHFQDPLFREIVTTLETRYQHRPDVLVSGNTFIYYQEGNPQRFISPDCYIAFNISKESIERFNTYRLWEIGKPPDFALEIGSPSTAQTDLTDKRQLYARLGIGEYWRYDATGGDFYGAPLTGEYLQNGQYHPFPIHHEPDGTIWSHSPTLNLNLCWENGRLRFHDPATNQWLLNHQEEQTARQAAEYHANDAEALAQAAEIRASNAETLAQAAETRANNAEALAQTAESRASNAESRANDAEAARQAAEALAQELRSKLRQLRNESS